MYWRVEYLGNRSVIIAGVTLIWRKAVASCYAYNGYETTYWRYLIWQMDEKSNC